MASKRRLERRRVAIVVGFLNSGGAERAALNMAAAATRSQCVVVAEHRGGDLSNDPLARGVVFASDSVSQAGRPMRVARLARALHRVRPEVVVSMLSPLVTATAARLIGVPVVHWLQAPWSRTTDALTGTLAGEVQRVMLSAAGRSSALVAAATPGLCDECVSLGIPARKVALLPNGIRIPIQGRRPSEREDAVATIVTIGRLEPQKRHDLTIRAVARIAEDRPVRLRVVGSGRDEHRLRALAAELGVAHCVGFTGFLDAPYEELNRADVFTLATDHEGFGNVIVEALACALPVVVSDVPYGPRFILDGGRYGELVAPGSASALEMALRRALDRYPLDEQTASLARRRAEAFDVARVAVRFEELIDLAQARKASVPVDYRCWA